MTQVAIFLDLSDIGLRRVGRTTRTLILHRSEYSLINEHFLGACTLSHVIRPDMTPGNGRDL